MIILAKRILRDDKAIRAGDWDSRNRLIGCELLGKTVGVVGFGRIGQRVAELCHHGFAMPILYYNVIDYPNATSALGARRVSLDELFQISDFISVHVPLVPATRGLINESKLRRMKPSAYLINTSRKKAVGQLKANVDEASEVGAQRVAFLSGKDPEDANRPAALDALIKSVKEICKYGRDKGIGLTCGIFDRSIDKKCLIGPTDYAAKFTKVIREDYPDFGLMYDLSHMPLLFEKVEYLGFIKDLLVHIHIGNCVTDPAKPGYGDLHPPFGWPGGSNDVPELINFLQALFNIGYLKDSKKERPWIGFEVKPQNPSQTPEAVIAGAKRVWQEAWSRV